VVVVGHQAVGVKHPVEAFARCAQHVEKHRPIAVLADE
jgi:hypothetical protein